MDRYSRVQNIIALLEKKGFSVSFIGFNTYYQSYELAINDKGYIIYTHDLDLYSNQEIVKHCIRIIRGY